MTKWIIVASIGVALVVFYMTSAELGAPAKPVPVEEAQRVTLVHAFKDGVHRYSGSIKRPHSCYGVDVRSHRDPRNTSRILLELETQDNYRPGAYCSTIMTPYPFETIVEAPSGVTAKLTIDGVESPVAIIESEWQNARGTLLNAELLR